MTSRWRVDARRLIAETVADALQEQPDLRDDLGALFTLVSQAYPYGPRKHHPYKIWLAELALARAEFAREHGKPLDRKCGACGATPGKPCRPISDDDSLIADREVATQAAPRQTARKLAADIVHAARLNPPSGPLFAEAAR